MSDAKCFKFEEVLMTETPSPVSFEIVWTIPNFSFFKDQTEMVESKARVIGKSSWHLRLDPLKKAGVNESAYDSVALYVHHSAGGSDTIFPIRAQIKLGIADKSHRFVKGKTTSVAYTYTDDGSDGYGTHTLAAHSDLFGPSATLLVDDGLIVRVEVKYTSLKVIYDTPVLSGKGELSRTCDDFQQSLRSLYDTKSGHDFVLVSSDGVKIPVHRAVLMSRSPVFLAMLESNMAEARTGLCEISDIEAGVLGVLVKDMYCGCSVDELKQNTEKILVAADKYQLTSLVNQCEQLLIKSLSKENLVDLLVLSEQTTTPLLKDAVKGKIKTSAQTEEFRGSGIMKEIFEKASAEFVSDIVLSLFR